MGYRVGGHCYGGAVEAHAAYYLQQAPVTSLSGDYFYTLRFEDDAGVWHRVIERVSTLGGPVGLISSEVAADPVLSSCDPSSSFADGMTVGWLIALVAVAVFCVKFLQRTAR